MLRVGFSEVDVTPEVGLPFGRLSTFNRLKTEGVKWPLCARLVVFEDGRNRWGLLGLDKNRLLDPGVAELRQAMTAETDLDPTDVMIACSHTHNVPYAMRWQPGDETGFAYLDLLKERCAGAMQKAVANLAPARLRVGHIDVPGLNVNRRPIYSSDLGEQVGTHGPLDVDHFLRMEGPVDSELKILLVEDRAGHPMGGVVNFACHPTTMYPVPVWSADYVGPLMETLKEKYGGVFVFSNGAAGNLAPVKSNADRVEQALAMGRTLAAKAEEAIAVADSVPEPRVRMLREVLHIPQRRPTAEQVELATWYLEAAKPGVDQNAFNRRISGHEYSFYHNGARVQEWLCRELLGMWEWQRRMGTRELIEDVEIQVVAIGDVAFAGYPSEIFTEFGLRTKAESPFANTFVVELANGWHGYIPTAEAFGRGGYETRFAYHSKLVPGAGDMMCDAALNLLNRLVHQ